MGKTKISSRDAGLGGCLPANVAVTYLGRRAIVNLTSPKGRGVWPAVLSSMEKNDFNIVEATLSTAGDTHVHAIHALIPEEKACIGSDELRSMLEELVMEKLRCRKQGQEE